MFINFNLTLQDYLMKNFFTLIIAFFTIQAIAQSNKYPTPDSKEYNRLKQENKIPPTLNLARKKAFKPNLSNFKQLSIDEETPTPASSSCSCYIPPDNTYTLAFAPNDDQSTGFISIPFNFCLYGTNYTGLYINNNGNVSFDGPYTTFSSSPFPDPDYVMVAPFWGDVDTRGTGSVRYKVTPTAVYVNWVGVGYYNSQTDKKNTFQLIITDGNDPILPNGNNIAFCYGDMQWTTGSASQGTNGFGGTPATVGINQGGNGGNYIQIGRYDQPGMAYDGGYGANDGVSWLDYRSFYFNSCNSTNISPIASGLNNCDTIRVCDIGDTLILNGLFLPPEINQTTTVTVNLNGMPGASVLNITNGSTATAQVQVIGSYANAGVNTITFTATDNGTPVASTTINVQLFIDTSGFTTINPVITGNLDFCQGGNTTLTVTPPGFDSYYWQNGSTTSSLQVDSTGDYWVTVTQNGCNRTTFAHTTEHPAPTPLITGNLFPCTDSTLLIVDSLIYTNYTWSNGNHNDSIQVGTGTYTVTVTDSSGCSATSPAVSVVAPVNPIITGITAVCNGDSAVLNTTTPFVSYVWSTTDTTDTVSVPIGDYTVTVTDIHGCTITSDTFTVAPFAFSLNVTGVQEYCIGQNITLTAVATPTANASYLWSTTSSASAITVNTGGNYTVTLSYPNGCTTDTTVTVTPPNPLPTPVITGTLTTCHSTPTVLSADPVYTHFVWSNTDTTNSVSVLSGNFTVTVTDTNGCVATSPAVTVVNSDPQVTISGTYDFCPGFNTVLTANPTVPAGASYQWSTLETTPSITVSTPGTYSVSIIYSDACNTADTVTVSMYNSPNADFTASPANSSLAGTPVAFTDASTISSDSIVNWVWNYGDSTTATGQNPAPHVYGAAGDYIVTLAVQSSNGCWDTISYSYTVAADPEAPNVFTPNGDGNNDLLLFKNLEYFPDTKLIIYNRWGNKIYETSDYQNNWTGDGHSNGVYYYLLTFSSTVTKDPMYGFFEILR